MPARSRSAAYADRASAKSLGLLSDASLLQRLRKRSNSTFDVKSAEIKMIQDLLPYQRDFVTDFEHKYVGFCGGYGSGKTHSLVIKQLLLCFRSQGFTHLFLEPTIPLIDDVALPKWNELLEKYGIPHTFKVSPRPVFKLLLPGGETPILLRSMENYERLIGVNAASIASDETDTTRAELAEKAMIRLQGRVRVGNCPQIVAGSTPEGYGWMYNFFEEQKADNKRLYRGKSEDNPYLDPGFVEDLKTKYHP